MFRGARGVCSSNCGAVLCRGCAGRAAVLLRSAVPVVAGTSTRTNTPATPGLRASRGAPLTFPNVGALARSRAGSAPGGGSVPLALAALGRGSGFRVPGCFGAISHRVELDRVELDSHVVAKTS